MGSSLAPTFAYIFMYDLEDKIIQELRDKGIKSQIK